MNEHLTAMELICTMTTSQVTKIYEESFVSQNMLTMSTAIKVLAKRGCYDTIADVFVDYIYIKGGHSLNLDSGFAITLGQSLFDLRISNPALGLIGKSIGRRSARGETTYDKEAFEEDISQLGNSLPDTRLKLKMYNLLDLLVIREGEVATEDDYKKCLESLSVRDIANMKSDTYNAIVNGLMNIYMASVGRVAATQQALDFIRETLRPQLTELSKNEKLVSKMKDLIRYERVEKN